MKSAAQMAETLKPVDDSELAKAVEAARDESSEVQAGDMALEQLDALIDSLTGTVDGLTARIAASDASYQRLSTDAAREYNTGKLARVRYNVLAGRLAHFQALRDETAASML